MIRALILALAFATSAQAKCIADDSWAGVDKGRHLAAGAMIGAAGALTTGEPLQGFAIGVGVGLLKELSDRNRPSHTCSLQDFAVTAAGAAIGASIGGLILSTNGRETRITYARSF